MILTHKKGSLAVAKNETMMIIYAVKKFAE